MWAPYVWPLYVRPLYVRPLYVSTLCVTTLREHSICDHSMRPLYMRPLYVTTLCETLCDHSMWALYVWPLYVSTLCATTLCETTLCETTLCEHSMCDHSVRTLYMWPPYETTLCETTLCVTALYVSMWAISMWPLYVSTLCGTTLCEHPLRPLYVSALSSVLGLDVAEHRKVGELPRKLDFSSWAGCCRTPKSTRITTKTRLQFLGRMLQNTEKYENYHEKSTSVLGPDVAEHRKVRVAEHRKARELPRKLDFSSWAGCCRTPKSTRITTKSRLQFLGRMLQNTEKYENYHEKKTSVLWPDVAAPKTSKKHEFSCKNTVQEHWRTPKSTRITTKYEHRRSWRAEKVRKFTDETRFRPFQEHRRSPKTEKYENYHEKWTSKKLKSRKLRKFTDKTRGRRSRPPGNYENSQTKRTCKHEATKIAMKSARHPSATSI